jgi:hypothetical protein
VELPSPTPSHPADLVDRKARRGRRKRNELPFRYLLDGRLFRLLCTSGPAAPDGFRASLERNGLLLEGSLPPLELTPLAFLEVIGVEPPRYDKFSLPQKVVRSGESVTITSFVVRKARDFFEKTPQLRAPSLRKRVAELREKTDPAAHELFDLCLTRFVSREGFERDIHGQLAFEFLFTFRFPDPVREMIYDFITVCLFAADENVSGLSKMRLIKTIWDRSYERLLKKHPGARAELQALDREMKPRTFKDYLEWEVVHHTILGFGADKEWFHPVAAFTTDSEETVKARCVAYKSALRAFLDQIDREELATTLRPRLRAWRPGLLVPCRQDGTFDTLVPMGELTVF